MEGVFYRPAERSREQGNDGRNREEEKGIGREEFREAFKRMKDEKATEEDEIRWKFGIME